jgi:hypothetical protein
MPVFQVMFAKCFLNVLKLFEKKKVFDFKQLYLVCFIDCANADARVPSWIEH